MECTVGSLSPLRSETTAQSLAAQQWEESGFGVGVRLKTLAGCHTRWSTRCDFSPLLGDSQELPETW